LITKILNCILSFVHNTKNINYTFVDVLPIEWDTVVELGYPSLKEITEAEHNYKKMITANWNETLAVNESFKLLKISDCFLDVDLDEKFNLVYFDAFAPNVQPVMWQKDVFDKIYLSLEFGSILVTYCAKGQVKRDLVEVGFTVEKLEGPPGKREMVRAIKA